MNTDDEIRQIKHDLSLLTRVSEKNTKDLQQIQKQINVLLESIIYTNPKRKKIHYININGG